MTFPGSHHPRHPFVNRMSRSPRNSCARWQKDPLPLWGTCNNVTCHILCRVQPHQKKGPHADHIPGWCNRRTSSGPFCFRNNHPREVSAPCEPTDLQHTCSLVLTSSTWPHLQFFSTFNATTINVINRKANIHFV